jgi:hypothetical protein
MAHFAKVVDGLVTDVIVVANLDCGGEEFPASEPIGQAFIASLGLEGQWLQTSYNNNFRKQYAGIDSTYNAEHDIFVSPQPYLGWVLDENFDWQAPVPKPEGDYYWSEQELAWVENSAG